MMLVRVGDYQRLKNLTESFSPLAQVSQLTEDFDFPNKALPAHFHYIGLLEKPIAASSFSFEALNGKPLVYVSFGTIVTTNLDIYHCIARACEGLGVQLVITRGTKNKGRSRAFEALPGAPLIVDYAPQMELLRRPRSRFATEERTPSWSHSPVEFPLSQFRLRMISLAWEHV